MHLFELYFFLNICPEVGLLDYMATLFLIFRGSAILFSIVAVPIYIPNNSLGGFPFLHTLLVFVICRLFHDGHSD